MHYAGGRGAALISRNKAAQHAGNQARDLLKVSDQHMSAERTTSVMVMAISFHFGSMRSIL